MTLTPPMLVGVALLGGVGAVARFALDGAIGSRAGRSFPYGTLAVNLSGAFALGLLLGATGSADVRELLGTGLIGSFTTFSTWVFESHRLAEDHEGRPALANLLISLVLGVALAALGRAIGGAL